MLRRERDTKAGPARDEGNRMDGNEVSLEQAALVQGSFARVFARKGEMTDRFYAHLFVLLPEAEPFFKDGFAHQKEMFASVLVSLVRSLSNPEEIDKMGDYLSARHARFKLDAEKMACAVEALMRALGDVLGGDLTAKEESAWRALATRLTQRMAYRG